VAKVFTPDGSNQSLNKGMCGDRGQQMGEEREQNLHGREG